MIFIYILAVIAVIAVILATTTANTNQRPLNLNNQLSRRAISSLVIAESIALLPYLSSIINSPKDEQLTSNLKYKLFNFNNWIPSTSRVFNVLEIGVGEGVNFEYIFNNDNIIHYTGIDTNITPINEDKLHEKTKPLRSSRSIFCFNINRV